MKSRFGKFAAVAAVAAAFGFGNEAKAQLFFSEYAEGSGFNKCVEIYHCGTDKISLADWQYQSYQNGNINAQYVINLSTIQDSIDAGEILVICNPGAVTNTTLTIANVDLFSNSIQFNGNDAVALYNTSEGAYSDIFGDASSTSNFAQNITYRRSATVTASNTFPGSNSTANWTSAANNDLSGFGSYSFTSGCPQAVGTACPYDKGETSCPIISQYFEGSGLNKCIEITNPTCDTLCLANFEYRAYHNGATTPTYQINLDNMFSGQTTVAGALIPGEVIVVCNPNADSTTLLVADTTWLNILQNGNDALAIYNNGEGSFCDIFGNIGEDSTWIDVCASGDTARTFNTNLTRKNTVCSGITVDPANGTGFDICTQWDQDTALNSTSGLGTQDVSFCQLIGGCGFTKNETEDVKVFDVESLNVYPNPTQVSATFEFTASTSESAVIEVFTLTGVMVAQPFNGMVEEGVTYREVLDVSHMPAGTYIYRFSAGAETKVGRISVIK